MSDLPSTPLLDTVPDPRAQSNADANAYFSSSLRTTEPEDQFERKYRGVGLSVSPGITWFPTRYLGIELEVNGLSGSYSKSKNQGNSDYQSTGANFSLGNYTFNPSFGFTFYL